MFRHTFATLCCILVMSVFARAGEVVKTDNTMLFGDAVSFDGTNLQFKQIGVADSKSPFSIPIRDIVRVRFQDVPRPLRTPPVIDPNRAVLGPVPAIPVRPNELSIFWQLSLVGGGVLSGEFESWSREQLKILLHDGRTPIVVPTQSIREIWRLSPDLIRKAQDLKTTSTTEDIAFVLKNNDIVPVKGTVLDVADLSLRFLYEGQEKKINLDHLLGVVLASQKRPPATQRSAREAQDVAVYMTNGDLLPGRWKSLEGEFVSIETSWNQVVRLPVAFISEIEIRSGRVAYLADLKPVKVEQTPYFDRVIPWRANTALDGGPLKINDGQQYERGIAMHSRCVVEYALDGRFDQFLARLGFEPSVPNSPTGRVAIRVLADGKPLFENADFRGDEKPKDLALDVHGAGRLTLEVDFGKDQDINDRIVWANARLLGDNADK